MLYRHVPLGASVIASLPSCHARSDVAAIESLMSAVGRLGRQALGHRRRGNYPTGQPNVQLAHTLADLPRRDKPPKVRLLIVKLAPKVYLVPLKLKDLVVGPGLVAADVDHAHRNGRKGRYDQRNPHIVTFLPDEC
jgi:hypothetical protein